MATPGNQGYQKLSDDAYLRMLYGKEAVEPSGFNSEDMAAAQEFFNEGARPVSLPASAEPDQPGYRWEVHEPEPIDPANPSKGTYPKYKGYAESYAEPGHTPAQLERLNEGANVSIGPRGNKIYTQTYGQQPPETPMSVLIAQAEKEQHRKNQRDAIEAELARESTSSYPTAGRMKELRETLAALGQTDLLRQLQEEAAKQPSTGQSSPGQPTTTTTINPRGGVSVSRRTGGGTTREALGEFSVAAARAKALGQAQGLQGPALDTFIRDQMAGYRGALATASGAGSEAGKLGVRLGPSEAVGGPGAKPGVSAAQAAAYETKRGGELAETAPQTLQDSIKAGLNLHRLLGEIEADPNLEKYAYSGSRYVEEGRDVLAGLTGGLIKQNSAYITWRQKLRQAALTAFDFGGKQLTQTEKAFVLATVPSGQERTPQEVKSVIRELRARVLYLTNIQSKLASLPREQYEQAVAKELANFSQTLHFDASGRRIGK